jgi:hypothetical protein
MEIIKFNPIYSITNYKVNSTITIKIQKSIQFLGQYKQKNILNKLEKKTIDFRNKKFLP